MTRYQFLKKQHMCVQCSRITERTLSGKSRCERCEKMAIASRRYKEDKRKRNGLCAWCGQPAEGRLCDKCREKERKYAADWRERHAHVPG